MAGVFKEKWAVCPRLRYAVFLCFAFQAFHRFFCATAILARDFADILRRLRVGLAVAFPAFPVYAPMKAESAAFNPDNWRSTLSRSFFNCFTIPGTFVI